MSKYRVVDLATGEEMIIEVVDSTVTVISKTPGMEIKQIE